jgi:hypothetical protein
LSFEGGGASTFHKGRREACVMHHYASRTAAQGHDSPRHASRTQRHVMHQRLQHKDCSRDADASSDADADTDTGTGTSTGTGTERDTGATAWQGQRCPSATMSAYKPADSDLLASAPYGLFESRPGYIPPVFRVQDKLWGAGLGFRTYLH